MTLNLSFGLVNLKCFVYIYRRSNLKMDEHDWPLLYLSTTRVQNYVYLQVFSYTFSNILDLYNVHFTSLSNTKFHQIISQYILSSHISCSRLCSSTSKCISLRILWHLLQLFSFAKWVHFTSISYKALRICELFSYFTQWQKGTNVKLRTLNGW